jgi:hypothetical protein
LIPVEHGLNYVVLQCVSTAPDQQVQNLTPKKPSRLPEYQPVVIVGPGFNFERFRALDDAYNSTLAIVAVSTPGMDLVEVAARPHNFHQLTFGSG